MSTSLWWAQLPEELAEPLGAPLPGDRDADVAIVGAGYTGLWTAYYLQRSDPSLRIAIIEAEVPGFGASGRNGGWASALFPVSLGAITAQSSRASAIRMQQTMHESVDELGRVATAEGWDVDWAKGGTLVAARTPLQLQRLDHETASMHAFGFSTDDYRMLDAAEARSRLGATDVLGAAYTPHCAVIQPAKLARQLARTVVANGADLYAHTPATAIEPGLVRTTRGVVRAPVIVRATEAYTPRLPGLERRVAPLYSLMIATQPLDSATWESIGLRDRETFSDGRNLIIYGQRTADGRLAFGGRGAPYIFGSGISQAQESHAAHHEELRRILVDLFPVLRHVEITHRWSGVLGVTRDWWASCGFDRRTGLAWCGGYAGDGVTTSNLGGRTLADLILERNSDLVDLPWVEHRSRSWEPEPLRWIGITAASRVVEHADATESRTGRQSRLTGRLLHYIRG